MPLPVIHGIIRRRILVNFRVRPEAMQSQLPSRFRPKLQGSHAIAGICLIRLESIRPRFVPRMFGLSSENAAHRVAVLWETEDRQSKEGVFVPRRDTGSLVTRLGGGRVFPGEHHRAQFDVRENSDSIDFGMRSNDRAVTVRVRGRYGGSLPATSCFESIEAASGFFEPGSVGYSVTREPDRLDGIELRTKGWRVEPLQVDEVHSSWFSDLEHFPAGTVEFDCALAMRNLAHEWRSAEDLYV